MACESVRAGFRYGERRKREKRKASSICSISDLQWPISNYQHITNVLLGKKVNPCLFLVVNKPWLHWLLLYPVLFYSLQPVLLNCLLLQAFKKGFPGGTNGKEHACQCKRHKICKFNSSWAWKHKLSFKGWFLCREVTNQH